MADFKAPPFQPVPASPELPDSLSFWKKDIMASLFCHNIGTIQSFDAEKQTATATLNYRQTRYEYNTATGKYDPKFETYPLLLDCPVIVIGGGTAKLTMPIAAGDECLILFNDRDIDNWFSSSQNNAPVATARLHSFSDGLILVGLQSSLRSITNYDVVRAVLRNGTAMVGVGPELVKIANEVTTLKTLLDELITTIKGLSISPGSFSNSGGPVTGIGAISASSQSDLDDVADDIAELLE